MGLGRDLVDLVTGRRPEVRNRVKFFLLSPIYDGFYRFLPGNPHAEILQQIAPDVRRLLDVCTGTALVPALVAPRRPDLSIVGLDLSPEMLELGQEKLVRRGVRNAMLVRGDAGTLPFPDQIFDTVTVSYGLHELPTAVRRRAVGEIRRVLRPGGQLIVADLDRPPRLGVLVDLYLRVGEPGHAREVLGDGLVRLLRAAGFAVQAQPARGMMPMQLLVARPLADLERRTPMPEVVPCPS
jgi:demethylmenaquinone methyltransferase/2-methoxy-6-polyprenyl-1,4-benzoquinol methylase